ncbi:MAG: enoyl-CoA hydratase/isomerase family protein [Candidatus Lokiarchaeota archaeon]|nr:enoyl-CoA hydratase/isomerase family protein [Candidatus Lokiarchaeota archaeon]
MSEKQFEHIKVELDSDNNYAVVSINRPDKLNALHNITLKEIADALESMAFKKSVRCVVLRGTKDYTKKPAFSAGADLSSRGDQELDPKNLMDQSNAMYVRQKYYDIIERFPKPLIAAVDGYALGGGFELALVCDIIIASKRSTFGFPEIKRGIAPFNGGTQRLIRNLGKIRTKTVIFFGEHYSAEEMYNWGVISFLVDDDKFEEFIYQKASWLGNAPTKSLFVIKKAIDYGSQTPLNIGLQFEYLGYGINSQSKDVIEGVTAFLQKREPKFTGE